MLLLQYNHILTHHPFLIPPSHHFTAHSNYTRYRSKQLLNDTHTNSMFHRSPVRYPARVHEFPHSHSPRNSYKSYKIRHGHKRSAEEYPSLDHHTKRYRTARHRDSRMTRCWSHIGRRSSQHRFLTSATPAVPSPLRRVFHAGQVGETQSPRSPLTWMWSYHGNGHEPDDPLHTPSRVSFGFRKMDFNGDVEMTDWNCTFPSSDRSYWTC